MTTEAFTHRQVIQAIESWLEVGEEGYEQWHHGYFSGHGWAARCLRWHLEQLKEVSQ
jgi:hypothetical protein